MEYAYEESNFQLRSDSRLTKYDGYLGKVNQSIAIAPEDLNGDEPAEHHPWLYDIDFVLGGKITNCHRREIRYTTADVEGMTGDKPRAKRQRKPSSLLQAAKAEPAPAQAKPVVPKKAKVKKAGRTKAKPSKGKTVTVPSRSATIKVVRNPANASGGSKCSKAKKKTIASEETAPAEDDDEARVKDLFEKHRKDFEKCFIRLEKLDHFGFFLEHPQDAPVIDTEIATNHDPAGDFPPISPTNEEQVHLAELSSSCTPLMPTSGSVPASPAEVDNPFANIPLTWFDLRTRRDAGRYIVDRLSKLEKERKKRLGPYVWDKRKKRKQLESEGKKAIETWEIQDLASKVPAKPVLGKRTFTRNGVRVHPRVLHPKGIDWELFRSDVLAMCDAGMTRDPFGGEGKAGTIGHAAKKIKEQLEQIFVRTGQKQMRELEFADARHEFSVLLKSQVNKEAAFQGQWRKIPFPERMYERLKTDVVCAGLSPLDEESASYEKQTELQDSFVGLAYTYNDTGESEGWMKSVFETAKSKDSRTEGLTVEEERAANALATDDGVVRAQVRATMRTLLIGVQDKVLTDNGVLKGSELRSANWDFPGTDNGVDAVPQSFPAANSGLPSTPVIVVSGSDVPDLVEQSVWGIDCYTRRNVVICIEKDLDPETAVEFVEKWLLPAINACPADLAHDLANAAKILEGLPLQAGGGDIVAEPLPVPIPCGKVPAESWSHSLIGKALLHKIRVNGPPWLKAAAHQLRRAIKSLGYDFFRVHPKGHGSIVLSAIVKANTLVTFYRGEVYPSWRWGEKLDAIEMTQQHIGLRPNLPDFYNMALERPQADPRGYGLMIVDASRKAGHGSMLSHSCDPTCEVRVAALNGQLCLAMTTLRNIEQGEELTFDYNAVTESLEEYQAAVCLCGCSKCRGSFLHFSTADCYQQVLNRNSPIAVRFANLVKGCTKKVMADEDNQTLTRHGFGTAAFGAISFNRHKDLNSTLMEAKLDSIANVPVWLRTYVADVLRYIEYERRALPVALLCQHFRANESIGATDLPIPIKPDFRPKTNSKKSRQRDAREKPENSFQYFVRFNKDKLLASLGEEKAREIKGMEAQHAIRTIGSTLWKNFTDEEKAEWKARAIADWEQQRAAELKEVGDAPANTNASKTTQRGSKPKNFDVLPATESEALNLSRISFEAADAEGVSAMEQRIQQLTQSLSRIGRVLDHHRETNGIPTMSEVTKPEFAIHPPLSIMTEHDVVAWMWCDDDGVVKSLLRSIKREKCAPRLILESLTAKVKEYHTLEDFVANPKDAGISPLDARKTLTSALLDLRDCLNDGVLELAKEFKKKELERGRMKAQARRNEAKGAVKREVMAILQGVVDQVVSRCGDTSDLVDTNLVCASASVGEPADAAELSVSPWLEHYHDRWKLEAAADIILLHARTSTFFKINPYFPVKSTPLEIYARELGNNIPLSTIKSERDKKGIPPSNIVLLREPTEFVSHLTGECNAPGTEATKSCSASGKKKGLDPVCDPDAVVANVTVTYSGDYVVSQLLQWFNGGVGQKQGLPDMVGCVILPSVEATFTSSGRAGGKTQKTTHYRSQVRPRLFDWLSDPHQRGSTFPEELASLLKGPELLYKGDILQTLPIGSPILDLLVMGDDANINAVLTALDHDRNRDARTGATKDTATTRLESTIDEAMPAQAVAKWAQCENEGCLKWRRLPFFVDVDVLPEQFFCKDNVWNPEAQNCNAPEDVWDACDSQLHNDGIEKESDKDMQNRDEGNGDKEVPVEQKYQIGDRFDVLRTKKKFYCTGEVVDIDIKGGTKKIKLHFPKVPEKFDEWIEVPSDRIAPLHSKQFEKDAQMMVSPAEVPAKAKGPKNAASLTVSDPSSVAATLLSIRHSTPLTNGEKCETVLPKTEAVASALSNPRPASKKPFATTACIGLVQRREPEVASDERQSSSDASFKGRPTMNRPSVAVNVPSLHAAELGCLPMKETNGGESLTDVKSGMKRCRPTGMLAGLENTGSEGQSSGSLAKSALADKACEHETIAGASINQTIDSKSSDPDCAWSSFVIPRKRKFDEDSSRALKILNIINSVTAESCVPRKTTFVSPVSGRSGEQITEVSLIAASVSEAQSVDNKTITQEGPQRSG